MTPHDAAAAWGVTLVERATSGANEVWFAMRGDEHVVLKIGDPEARAREATALDHFGPGGIRVLERAPGALLVERVLLGDDLLPLARVDDDAATSIIGQLLRSLHSDQRPSPTQLPDLGSLVTVFDGEADTRLDHSLVTRAAALFSDLVADGGDTVLHGDLHQMNVVRDGSGNESDRWRAIDPHGWVGDPAFDTAPLMANPRGLEPGAGAEQLASLALAQRRAAILADTTGLDRERILAWAFVAAVIAERWMLEDHGFVHGAPLALAQALRGHV